MEDRRIDEMFRSLQDREIAPSSNALKSLQDALNEADRKKKKRKLLVFGWVAAAVAVIVLSIGINLYSTDKLELDTSSIVEAEVKSETEKIDTIEEVFVETKITNESSIAESSDRNQSNISESAILALKKTTRNTSKIASTDLKSEEKRVEEVAVKERDSKTLQAEKTEVAIIPEQEKRKTELLKPIDDAELDSLLKQEQVAMAMEKLVDDDIMRLLYEAQITLEIQDGGQYASSEAERLLEQATMEMEADKSLRSILNKAIETGLVEVQAFFKNDEK